MEIPYNIPHVTGTVIDLYSRWDETLIPADGFPATFRHPAAAISVMAGTLLSVTGDKTFALGGANVLRIKFAADGTHSTYQICQCYERDFELCGTMDVTAVTSDVYDDGGRLILRGGTFNYTFAVIVYGKDCPYAQQTHFLEFYVGEEVNTVIGGASRAYEILEMNYGVGGGVDRADPDRGGPVLVNMQGYPSGLELTTVADHGGARISGTASRPGLYWVRVWIQSIGETPRGTGSGGANHEFPGGESSEIFIISIRPRSPVEGDLVCLVDAPVKPVDKNTFQVLRADIPNTNDFQTHITSKEPADVWEYHDGVWDEPPVWTRPPTAMDTEFLDWLASLLDDEYEPQSSGSTPSGGSGSYTGHTHLAGYWTRNKSIPVEVDGAPVGALRWWYVICRDDDGFWRLYCALDTNATYPWFTMARTPELGLDGETPPKYWPSIHLVAKGSERYVVPGHGVFAWAGTFEYPPPDAEDEEEPDTVTVEVFGQEPLYTPRYQGWTEYLPPEWRYNTNELLYQHPEHGWVCVPSLDTEITAANAGEYRCSPQTANKVAVPFAPVRPPQLRGGLTFERDKGLVSAGAALCFSQAGNGRLALLAEAAGRLVSSGAVWWRYPLFRFWNLERMRMTIEARFSVNVSGGPVNVDSFENMTWFQRQDNIYGPSPWSEDMDDYQHPYVDHRGKSYSTQRDASDADGTYEAAYRVENIPCHVSDYLLIACVAKGTAATSASAHIHAVNGSVYARSDSSEEGYKPNDDVSAIRIYEAHSSVTRETGDSFEASGSEAKCAAQINATLGYGCEVAVCPVVRRGDRERPRQARVFAAAFSASCEWKLTGTGRRYDGWRYTSWTSEATTYDKDTGEETGHTVNPKPADGHYVPFERTVVERCAASWDSGLVLWNGGGTNRITADHTEITANLWKDAAYLLQTDEREDFDGEESWATRRCCRLDVSTGHVSGRSTWKESGDDPAKYPLQEISASASRTDFNDSANDRTIREYDASDGSKHSAAEVIAEYEKYRAWVEEAVSPSLGHLDFNTYPGHEQSMQLDQEGSRTEARQERRVEMTITITDAGTTSN